MAVSPMLIKAAAALLTDEKGRKGVGFLLVTLFAPVILIAAILTALNVFDEIAKFAGAGTLVPITGFSNAVVSPAMARAAAS